MIMGTVITLAMVVAKTPTEASRESPPKRVVKIGVVDAEGIADCSTIMARHKGVSEGIKPVMKSAKIGIITNLHKTISSIESL